MAELDPPARRSRDRWGLLFLASGAWWALVAVVSAANQVGVEGAPWGRALLTSVVAAAPWVPLAVGVYALSQRVPLRRRSGRPRVAAGSPARARPPRSLPRALAIHLAAAAAVVLLRAAFIYSLDPWLGWYVQPPRFSQVALHSVQNNLFLYWLLVGASHAVIYARDAIERERAAVQLEAALGRAELAALTSTLHPHFLFNTLGAIAELVHRDPHATDRMVVQLAGMLRRLLDDRRPVIALADELAFSRDYLAIEQVRFGDLLTVRWSVEPDALAAAVPRLAIQPLIENALRHGLWPAGRPGVLTIAGHRRGDDLVVTVTDDGVGLPAAGGPGSVGQGLATIRARVDRLYDGRGALTVAPRAAGGTEARLVLPWGAACAS